MTHWEMEIGNGQPGLKNVACLGEGQFDGPNGTMNITVERTE